MSREVRMVPADWKHPKDEKGWFIPLLKGSFKDVVTKWDEEARQWDNGFIWDFSTGSWEPKSREHTGTFTDYDGERPVEKDYMPDWPESERTHYQMYEAVSEGTPISPVMETQEALARWLTENKASAGPYATATYDQWLAMIKVGSSCGSFVIVDTTRETMSGVEAVSCLE